MAKTEKKKDSKKKDTKVPAKVTTVPKAKKSEIPVHASYLIIREKLGSAFSEIRKQKIVCIAHHRADIETGTKTILEMVKNSKKREYLGFLFFTSTDERALRETGTISLTVGVTDKGTLPEVVKTILGVLIAQGLNASWNEKTIAVSL